MHFQALLPFVRMRTPPQSLLSANTNYYLAKPLRTHASSSNLYIDHLLRIRL